MPKKTDWEFELRREYSSYPTYEHHFRSFRSNDERPIFCRVLTNPATQTRYVLKSGKELWLTPQEENLLKGGYYATANSSVRRGQLFDLLKRIYAQYNFNAYEMSEDLVDAFPNCHEYERREFYKWFPPLRDISKAERRLDEALEKAIKEAHGDLEKVKRRLWKKSCAHQPLQRSSKPYQEPSAQRLGTKKGDPRTYQRSNHKNRN